MASRHTRKSGALLALVALVIGIVAVAPSATAASTPPAGNVVALGDVGLDPQLTKDLNKLPSITPYGVFVHFRGGSAAEHRALIQDHGMEVGSEFHSVDVVYAWGSLGDVAGLTAEESVEYLQANRKLKFFGATAPWATRARVAQKAVSGGPYKDGSNQIIDGRGVPIYIVDSGLDGTHPDLDNRIVHNYKIVCTTPGLINTQTGQCFGPLAYVDTPDGVTDNTSGHGTHVAGIAAGDGTASGGTDEGTFMGVAPGADIIGYGTGETIVVLYAAEAFQHILDNHDFVAQPRIIVSNSWGDDPNTVYDPSAVENQLVDLLVAKGATVTFAAGNSGNASATDRTSSYCKNPTPGVICVAWYNDNGTGSIDGTISASSSHGQTGVANASRWPDIAAPGQSITSTCGPNLPICGPVDPAWPPRYGTISGTSMATPHVAGAAALLYQANPTLAPAQVEDVLQDTSRKFGTGYVADPQNLDGTIDRFKGSGLLNVQAALDKLGVAKDGIGNGGGGGGGTPTVTITNPADQQTFLTTDMIPVSGTAFDGVGSPVTPTEQTVFVGDTGDVPGQPEAYDLEKLTVLETSVAGVEGMRYTIEVADLNDRGATTIPFRVTQNVNGVPRLTEVVSSTTGVTPAAGSATVTAPATSASQNLITNEVTFFVPFTNLGNPPALAPAHNVFASVFNGVIIDVAPGGPGPDVITAPQYGHYTILRPTTPPPVTAAVELSVDAGAATLMTVAGTGPNYTWSSPTPLTGLSVGSHTLTATLKLNGVSSATNIITIHVEDEPTFTDQVLINSPADGSTVARALIEVRGTSFSDRDAELSRAVTLQVEEVAGPYDSGQLAATGTSPWTQDVNFASLDAGDYTLTARLFVDDILRATHAITVTVPPPDPPDMHDVVITSPSNTDTVPRQVVTIEGTSSTTSSSTNRLVTVQITGGGFDSTELNATGTDSWTRDFNFDTLTAGDYSITARHYVDGSLVATHAITVTVEGSTGDTYSVAITDPTNGATVPRSNQTISGTSATSASGSRSVTLQVSNAAYDSGELPASGTNSWTRNFNFNTVAPGSYTLTARHYVGGVFRAIHSITVNVPDPDPSGQVSCAGRSMGFWRQQFSDNGKSQKFTDEEANTLAAHAVSLSEGYFSNSQALLDDLFADGNLGDKKRAGRQFAALLLNLAAGDLSKTMSIQVGYSGNEGLDPGTYNTAVIGNTVDEAKSWIRDQLRAGGDKGGANEVGTAINEFRGIIC